MAAWLRHPLPRALAVSALIAATGCALLVGVVLLLGGTLLGYLGLVFEVLPAVSTSSSATPGHGGATALGLGLLALALAHLGVAAAAAAASRPLWLGRARRFVLTCCGLMVLLGIGTTRWLTPNSWSNVCVLGGLFAAVVAYAVPRSSLDGREAGRRPSTSVGDSRRPAPRPRG